MGLGHLSNFDWAYKRHDKNNTCECTCKGKLPRNLWCRLKVSFPSLTSQQLPLIWPWYMPLQSRERPGKILSTWVTACYYHFAQGDGVELSKPPPANSGLVHMATVWERCSFFYLGYGGWKQCNAYATPKRGAVHRRWHGTQDQE